jgi:hypothetical protein
MAQTHNVPLIDINRKVICHLPERHIQIYCLHLLNNFNSLHRNYSFSFANSIINKSNFIFIHKVRSSILQLFNPKYVHQNNSHNGIDIQGLL